MTAGVVSGGSQCRRMLFLTLALCFCAAYADDPPQAPDAGPLLDGSVYIGPTGARGRDVNHEDRVVFSNGRFLSEGCSRWGFGDAAYSAWHDGHVIRFRAVTESEDHGTLAWEGTVHGQQIEATFVWTKDRILWTTRRAYWFRGTRTDDIDGPVAFD